MFRICVKGLNLVTLHLLLCKLRVFEDERLTEKSRELELTGIVVIPDYSPTAVLLQRLEGLFLYILSKSRISVLIILVWFSHKGKKRYVYLYFSYDVYIKTENG